jgi:hypothetical protein
LNDFPTLLEWNDPKTFEAINSIYEEMYRAPEVGDNSRFINFISDLLTDDNVGHSGVSLAGIMNERSVELFGDPGLRLTGMTDSEFLPLLQRITSGAGGARAPAAVASCAISTVVCRTIASISRLTFTAATLRRRPAPA